MRKVFCDHCGKEISGPEVNEIDSNEAIWDNDAEEHVGWGCELCNDCWDERVRLHVKLEREFLHLDKEGEA